MKAVVEPDGRIRLPDEIRDAAQLEAGQELEVAYGGGVVSLSIDDIPFMDEEDEAWWGPDLREKLEESLAEAKTGKGRVFMSTEEFIAHLESVDASDPPNPA